MSSHGRKELNSHNADSIFDEELVDEGLSVIDEYASDDGGGMPVEEEEGALGVSIRKQCRSEQPCSWTPTEVP